MRVFKPDPPVIAHVRPVAVHVPPEIGPMGAICVAAVVLLIVKVKLVSVVAVPAEHEFCVLVADPADAEGS